MKRRRVVITGLGVVAPNGIGKEAFWANLIAGHSAVDYITAFDASDFPCKVAAEVKNFDPTDFMPARKARTMGRFSQFAVAAARLAVEDARLRITPELSEKIKICFGTTVNGLADVYEDGYLGFLRHGLEEIPPTTVVEYAAHAAASHVSIELGTKGQTSTLSVGCSTGLDVVQWGAAQIQSGKVEAVIAGASDAPIFPFGLGTFCALSILSNRNDLPTKISCPYDRKHDGMVLAEGGGVVILEDLDHALERNAEIYAEILGFSSVSESKDLRKLDITGTTWARAIRETFKNAEVGPGDIDAVNAHGNSAPQYDIAETNALKNAFGEQAYHISIHSLKSMIGHALAASGIFQVISSCLTIRNSVIPPTINCEIPDSECDLDYVPNDARMARVRRILVSSRSMGGTYTMLVVSEVE